MHLEFHVLMMDYTNMIYILYILLFIIYFLLFIIYYLLYILYHLSFYYSLFIILYISFIIYFLLFIIYLLKGLGFLFIFLDHQQILTLNQYELNEFLFFQNRQHLMDQTFEFYLLILIYKFNFLQVNFFILFFNQYYYIN